MKYLIFFIVFFIIIYVLYYFLYVRRHIEYDEKNLSADVKILKYYYGVDIEKVGYMKTLRILNFVNSLMLTSMMMIVVDFDKYVYKFVILLVLMVPFIWVTYYFLAKYLKYLERKSE